MRKSVRLGKTQVVSNTGGFVCCPYNSWPWLASCERPIIRSLFCVSGHICETGDLWFRCALQEITCSNEIRNRETQLSPVMDGLCVRHILKAATHSQDFYDNPPAPTHFPLLGHWKPNKWTQQVFRNKYDATWGPRQGWLEHNILLVLFRMMSFSRVVASETLIHLWNINLMKREVFWKRNSCDMR